MEQEACTNFKSIRAKFQEETQPRHRPAVPEKPKFLLTSAVDRSGLITMSFSSAVDRKTASQPRRVILREDLKTPSGKHPPSTTSADEPNSQSLKMRHLPLVMQLSREPKHDFSKGITMKPIPTPFSSARVSVCGRGIGKNGLGLVKNSGAFNVLMEGSTLKTASTEAVEVQKTMVSSPGSLDHSAPPSPNDSLADSSSGSVTHFFDQHVLEKAKRKLCYRNLLVCSRPRGFYFSKAQAQHAESPESYHQETSPVKINGASKTAINVIELGGVMQPEKACKPLPDLASLGPSPSKPPRPPHVDLSQYKTGLHISVPSEALTVESAPEPEIVMFADASLEDASVPPPEFPDFDIFAPETTDSNAMNLAALDLEATEFPKSTKSEDAWCHSVEDALISTSATEAVTSDLRTNGSHATFNLSTEHQHPSEPISSQHETFDNVYEDVETIPRISFAQSSYKCKGAHKKPYADNGLVKEETWRNIWHGTQWSNAAEDQNGQHDGKKLSPEHHEDKEQKKKEKQRLEKEKKEQKEKDKKRNEMHKKFQITGREEPMYHARVLADSKLRKYDLPVRSGDLISIIRTVSCPKGKWLAKDANNKYGYISVMNVELNIKEMLELGKRVSLASGRSQTNGDELSVSSRSSHQNPVFTSSFSDDSEEWMYDTLSLSAEILSPIKATSMPEMFDSNSSAHHPFSDWSIEDIQTQEAESFQFADVDLLPPPELYADSLDEGHPHFFRK
ncbi:uncharacterized protein LOC113039719 isoform X2 [Carassius auratus]|uniref:Uncharacterized protein LOC113039719 isoform X2 n=1 Tax=Carassius auratus TaxID=7957 RepID=A0A6P6J0J0_CARAU|nr:uncharacterized protein LOC113039719 isoform X2 [Carassius auratus]